MEGHSLHGVVFTLLFYISVCSSDGIHVERIATEEYAGYRCGTTFFPRSYVLEAARRAAQAAQVGVLPEQMKIVQYLQDQRFYGSAPGTYLNLHPWPILIPALADSAAANHFHHQTVDEMFRLSSQDYMAYFLVLGSKLEPFSVVYRPTPREDLFTCEQEMEISNVPDKPNLEVFGFRCPTRLVSIKQVKDAAYEFYRANISSSRISDRDKFDGFWQIFQVEHLFYNHFKLPSTSRDGSNNPHTSSTLRKDERLYKWPIDYERPEFHDYRKPRLIEHTHDLLVWEKYARKTEFAFVVLGKDERKVGVVQQINLTGTPTYVKCKLTASNRPKPEFIDSNLQQKPQKIDPRVQVDVFKCGRHYFKPADALKFATQASHEYKQGYDRSPKLRQLLSLFKSSYTGGSGRLYLWEVVLNEDQVEENYPLSKIFKRQKIFIVIDDLSDVLGVLRMRKNNQLENCERKIISLEIYQNYVKKL